MLVELMVRLHAGLNIKVFQQESARPRIFRKNQITVFQHADRSQRNIFQISNRCWNHYQFTHLPTVVSSYS